MKYTISFDASVKIKKNDIKGHLYHCARDATDKNLNHKNQNINKALTGNNITLYNTGDGFDSCDEIEQIEDYIETRLKSVKKKLRKDAVIMRPLLLQLDPDYTDSHSEDEVMAQASNMMDWAVDTFGQDNIAFLSIHKDETNPHIHVGFMPVTDDGRLTQKEWFPNPQSLRKMHDSLRDYMISQGYNATKERVSGARKRLSEDEYKALMKQEEREAELFILENKLKARGSKIDSKTRELDEREKSLDEREKSLELRYEALERQKQVYLQRQKEIEEELYSDATHYIRRTYDNVTDMHTAITSMHDDVMRNLVPVNQRQQVINRVADIKQKADNAKMYLPADKGTGIERIEEMQKRRKPLSEGLSSDTDKDDYDFSL